MPEQSEWRDNRLHVISEQRRMSEELHQFRNQFEEFARLVLVDIAMLKVKSTAWGALGGALTTAAGLAVWAAARSMT